jgi:hypothetical protein
VRAYVIMTTGEVAKDIPQIFAEVGSFVNLILSVPARSTHRSPFQDPFDPGFRSRSGCRPVTGF